MLRPTNVIRSKRWTNWTALLATFSWALIASWALITAPLAQAQKSLSLPPELKKLRAAVEKYKDPIKAAHDGYFSTLVCVEYTEGGMGVHFINPRQMGPVPDPMKPQILLYIPDGDKLRLAAVEWFIPLATGVKGRPKLFGQDFHGPMSGHEPAMPKELHHYDLHAWLFDDNPAGLFSDTNPNVKCVGKRPYALLEKPPPTVPHK